MAAQFVPWNSIAESVVELEPRRLSFAQALESPCDSCRTAPCCTYLPLAQFRVASLMDLDQARYLINFDHIQLTLSASGDWNAYYVYPCRFLNRENFRCTVHDTPQQPRTCVNYNPYQCLYKRVFTTSQGADIVRLDHQRVEFVASQVVFDEHRKIVSLPPWEALIEGCRQLPALPPPEPTAEPAPDAMALEWRLQVLAPEAVASSDTRSRSFASFSDPCERVARTSATM